MLLRNKSGHFLWRTGRRLQSTQSATARKMGAWQFHSYGDEPLFSDKVRVPPVSGANEVLVKISATSLNPIDLAMSNGYGSSTWNVLRKCKSDSIEFPLTLGRDFVGEVVHRGMGVRNDVELGHKVWGTVPIHKAGTLAEYVSVDANFISNVPKGVDDTEAAAVPYAGLTAWSGLYLSGELGELMGAISSVGGGRGKRVCVLGASGGVGNLAVQMARSEGVDVVATCAADATEMVTQSGANTVIDYRLPDVEQQLAAAGPYDIVLDCAGKGPEYAAKVPWTYGHYVTFSSPLLRNTDERGLIAGSVQSILDITSSNVQSLMAKRGLVKWAFIAMLPNGLEYLRNSVETKKIKPLIDSTFDFKDADAAFRRLKDGHLRGKIVIKM